MKIKFNLDPNDRELIKEIVDRAWRNLDFADEITKTDIEMDITATHLNGCVLNLKKLLLAKKFTFNHDIGGIRYNLNRETGQLDNHFLPRCHN